MIINFQNHKFDIHKLITLPRWVRYACVVVMVLLAAIATHFIPVIRQTGHGQWFLFLFAITISAICFGLYPGVLALLLSLAGINVLVLSHDWIFNPFWAFNLNLSFCILSGIIIAIAQSQKNLVKQLYESQQDLNLAQEVAQVGSWRFKVKGNELYWTDEKYRIFEIAVGVRVTIDTFFSAIHPEDREYVDRMWQASLKGEPYDIEHRIIVANGKVKWIREKATLEFTKNGALLGGFGTTQDITKRKLTEQELRDKEEKLQLIMDLTPNLVCYIDTDFRYVRINKTYETWWNKKSEQILGHEVREIVGEQTWSILQPYMERTIMGEAVSFDHRSLNGNDAIQWVHVDYVPDFDSTGAIKGFVVQVANISERKLAEQKLIEQENQLRLIMNLTPALISYLDTDFRYKRANKTYEDWYGISVKDIIGLEVRAIVGEKTWAIAQPYLERARTGEKASFEHQLSFHNNALRWSKASFVPDIDSSGMVKGIVVHVADIDERKLAEQQIAILNRNLAQRIEEMETFLNTAPVGLCITNDLSAKAIRGNPAIEQMLGLTTDSELSLGNLFPPPIRALVNGAESPTEELPMQRAVRGENVINQLLDIQRPDGTTITMLSNAAPLFNPEGGVRGAVGAFLDVTALKNAESALRDSEERLRLAQTAGNLGIFDQDLVRGEMHWDECLRELWGIQPGELLVTDTCMARIHLDDRAQAYAAVKSSLNPQGNGDYHAEYRIIRPIDGRVFWLAAFGTTTFDNGRPIRLVGFVQDISERKFAEVRLRDTEARLALALNELKAGYWDWNLDSNEVFLSSEWKQQLGYIDDEVPNRYEEWENRLHPDDKPGALAKIKDYLNGHLPDFELEFRLQHKDGSYRWIHSRAALTQNQNNASKRLVGIHLDITDYKKTKELSQQRDRMEEAFRLNVASQTVAAIAHELNQPLTAISHFSDVAVDMVKNGNQNPEKLAAILESCSVQAQRAGEVIRQLMALLQRGEFLSEPVDINKMVNFAYEYIHKNNNLNSILCELKLADNLPNVLANSLHIQKILIILIQNSLDAIQENKNPPGKLTLSTCIYPRSPSMVRITASDNGIGVTDISMLNKIFQPFYSTKSTGLGMGLAISRALVEAHGGKMWAEQNADIGISVHFTLPLAP